MFLQRFFLIVVSIFSFIFSIAQANQLDSEGFLRDDSNKVLFLTQEKAMTSCPEGTHLPTSREYAIDCQKRGAQGSLEYNEVNPHQVPENYYLIEALNPDGSTERFYFNFDGYVPPEGLAGVYPTWSSTIHSQESTLGYVRTGDRCEIYLGQRNYHLPVMCVSGK
jgi:hypothetical protein